MAMSDSGDALRTLLPQLAKAKGTSLRALSKAVGRNDAYLQQFVEKGSPKVLPEAVRYKLAEELGVAEDMLRAPQKGKVVKLSDHKKALSPSDEITIGENTYLPVPVYDIRAAAGAGALVEDGPATNHQIFREQFLHRITRARLSDLSVIQVSGDSMWETLHDGDSVLVDRSITRIVKDGIYILNYEDELLVKRCQRDLSDGSVLIKSDNPRYDTIRVKKAENLHVLGRVIWIGRALG